MLEFQEMVKEAMEEGFGGTPDCVFSVRPGMLHTSKGQTWGRMQFGPNLYIQGKWREAIKILFLILLTFFFFSFNFPFQVPK